MSNRLALGRADLALRAPRCVAAAGPSGASPPRASSRSAARRRRAMALRAPTNKARALEFWQAVYAGTGWHVDVKQIQGRLVPVVCLNRHDELPRALALFHAKSGVADWRGPRVAYAGGSVNLASAGNMVGAHTKQHGNLGWGVLDVDEAASAIFHVKDLQRLVQDGVKRANGAESVHHGYVVDTFVDFDDQNFEICGLNVKRDKKTRSCCYYVCAAACARCPRRDPARRPKKAPRADGTKKRPVSDDDGERFSEEDDEKVWMYVTERGGPGDWKGAVPLFGGRFTDMQITKHYSDVVKPSRDPEGRLLTKMGAWTDEADNAIVAAFHAMRRPYNKYFKKSLAPTTDATAAPSTVRRAALPTTTDATAAPRKRRKKTAARTTTTSRGHPIRAAIDRGDDASAVLGLFKGANVVVSGALWKDLRVASEERIIYVLRYMLEAHCKRRGSFTLSTDVVIASAEEMSNAGKAKHMSSSASRARVSKRAVLPPTDVASFRGAVVSLTGSVDNAVVEAMETAGATVGRFDVDDNVTYLVEGSVIVAGVYESDCSKKQRDAWSRGIPVVEVGDVVALLEAGDAWRARAVPSRRTPRPAAAASTTRAGRGRAAALRDAAPAKRSRAEPPAPVSPAGFFAAPAPDDDVVPRGLAAPDASMDDASPVRAPSTAAPSPAAPSPVRAPPSPGGGAPRSGSCADITNAPLGDVAKIAKARSA
ncbi:hypothetical protein JL720_3502 [Aureococcus anophagefferens]|nr:hypothetical protein JL720_3502 [Aureococcus anophagefferens]